MNALPAILVGVLVGVGSYGMPALIAALPEPAPAEPVEGAPETELDRMLAEEGPKPLYADIARWRPLPWVLAGLGALLMYATLLHLDDRVAWVLIALTPLLLALAYIDIRTRLLPRILVLPATGVVVVLALADWAHTRDTHVLIREAVAMLVARSVFWLLWLIRRSGMGFGDVRLAALVGLVLGRVSWSAWVVGLYGGLIAFSLFGLGLMVVRRDRRTLRQGFPYGPFMIGGLYLGVLTSGLISLV